MTGVAVAVIGVVVGVGVVVASKDRTEPSTPTPVAAGWCEDSDDGTTVIGNGPGSQSSGPDAILAFEYGYYVERSGEKARQVVAPDAKVTSAKAIQSGIDQTPESAEHCLTITRDAPDLYSLTINERRDDGENKKYSLVVGTGQLDGRTVITSIGGS